MSEIKNWPIVYQMGKVGSVSVQVALGRKGLDTLHAHYLVSKGEFNTDKPPLVKLIKEKDREWKVITLARDPLARNISAFFNNLPLYVNKWMKSSHEQRLDAFISLYKHSWCHDWFDKELKKLFGINVYKYPFPHSKGYYVLRDKGFCRVLVLRTEDMTRVAPVAFKEFMGLENVRMGVSNETVLKKRDLGKMYDSFRKQAIFPERWLRRYYNTKYAKHFYSDDERERLIFHWKTRKSIDNPYPL